MDNKQFFENMKNVCIKLKLTNDIEGAYKQTKLIDELSTPLSTFLRSFLLLSGDESVSWSLHDENFCRLCIIYHIIKQFLIVNKQFTQLH